MAISNFKITELPSNIISKIGANPVLEDKLYDIADESNLNFERITALDGLYLNKKLKYKAYDNQLQKYSNEASIALIWKEQDTSVVPASQDSTALLENSQTINLLEYLPINSAVEFIQVEETTEGLGSPSITDIEDFRLLTEGNRFTPEDLFKSKFTVLERGGGTPYYVFKYKVGKNNQTEPTVYTFQINVDAEVEMKLTSQETLGPEFITDSSGTTTEVITEVSDIQITGGSPLAEIKLSFDLSNFLPTTPNNINRFTILIGNQTIQNSFSFGDLVIDATLNESGIINYTTEYIKENIAGLFQAPNVSIIEINGQTVNIPLTLTFTSPS